MRRNRAPALILLLFTLAPLAIWAFVLITPPSTFEVSPVEHPPEQVFLEPSIQGIALAGLITLGLMAFYLIHLYRTSRLSAGWRALWLVLIVFGNIFTMPLYWYLHVWQRHPNGAA